MVNTYDLGWTWDGNEDRVDHDVDIFNIIQRVQDTVIHLEVDEEQWKITQGSKRQAKWVRSPRAMSCLRLPDTPHARKQQRYTRLDRHAIYSGRQACGRTNRGHTGGRSDRISPPSFCGACLNFYREKDSAVPFPRRP